MGNPAIGGNSDYWQLYAKNPNIREGAQQRFGVSTNPFEASVAKTSNGEKYSQYAKYDTIKSPDTRTAETGQKLYCMG